MVTRKTSTAALGGALPKTKRCTPTSTSLRRHSAPTSTDGGCTRPWCTGRPRTPFAINHGACSTMVALANLVALGAPHLLSLLGIRGEVSHGELVGYAVLIIGAELGGLGLVCLKSRFSKKAGS